MISYGTIHTDCCLRQKIKKNWEEAAVSLGAKLKSLRIQKKASLQQVAEEVGASKAHIWELETGRSKNPSLTLLTELAKFFKVPIASLVGEDDDELQSNDRYVSMYRDFKDLNEDQKAIVEDMIESLKKRQK